MKIKNYTSEVPAARSISRIEEKLVSQGARNILKEYDEEGRLAGLSFIIAKDGRLTPFKIPAKVDNVEALFAKQYRRTPRKKIREQAERTAWKIMSDWIDIQMSLIELEQAEFLEIFLPYVYDLRTKKTYFNTIKDNGYNLLPEKT
jgi:hypothetical protein